MIKDILEQLAPLDAQIAALKGRGNDMEAITAHASELAELAVEEDDPDFVIGGAMIGWQHQQMKEFSRTNQCYTHYASIEYLNYLHTMLVGCPVAGWRTWGGTAPAGKPNAAAGVPR